MVPLIGGCIMRTPIVAVYMDLIGGTVFEFVQLITLKGKR